MAFKLSKRSRQVLRLLLLLFLPLVLSVPVMVILSRPFNLLAQLAIRWSKYKRLLPYIMAQSRHETNDFKSAVYRREHNLFGMKEASRRRQLGSRGNPAPDGGYYRHYTGDLQSVRDYMLYLDAVNFPVSVASPEQFVSELDRRNYFGDAIVGGTDTEIYLGGLKRFLA